MARYIEDGTYDAEGVAASVYRKENGNVILLTEWALPSLRKTIRSWDCVIIGSTGEIREKALANIRKWATGWDGTSFGWFPANVEGLKVELVIENQPVNPPEYDENGNPRTTSRVKWVNPVGGRDQKEMRADESAALDRIFAAKLRANAGARPVGGAAGVAKPAQTPPKPASAPSGAPAPAGGAATPPATRESVWASFCGIAESLRLGKDERSAKFLELVAAAGLRTDYDDWTGENWGRLQAEVDAWNGLPF